ncbi:hypothetical protein CspeluHIS016_0110280 [Cutaneotrichosporon spelunceum]|uniref:Autophagy-related protein 13 n=1 Tax=Cutaneotrichosporon spelunceum TaxID=1672016 RepID=A0AAD3YA35_9TREE|nr:hypothetical protein CspeluHIS016_0110280 [Cutaneotrichosporon spelunceum]
MNITSARAFANSAAGPDPRRNSDATATSSAASSQVVGGASRADQIIYRFYLKTVAVLVDGRVTHVSAQRGEHKKDRWTDLRIYRAVSSYTPLPDPPTGTSRSTIPPLLIAFILDTNDIPAGQTLLWNRDGARLALDPSLAKHGGSGTRRPGIVLERWTLRVSDQEVADPAESEMAPPTAYRLGIIHFRALYAFIRLLPAYRLFKRLRRLNTGLRLGIKLWGPEGYSNSKEGRDEAWNVMERDLVGIDVPLEYMIPGREPEATTSSTCERYDFPALDLFGSMYELGVEYRPNMDFDVEDMESVLSERFVDMDEDWFTPTVARHRLEAEARAAGTSPYSSSPSRPSPVQASPSPARYPIPGSSLRYETGSYRPSSGTTPREPSSLGAAKWGALGENLPFASGAQNGTPPSPSAATGGAPSTTGSIPYRRLSAHSFQPFRSYSASPSASVLRNLTVVSAGATGTPAASGTPGSPNTSGNGRAIPGPSTTGRQSSFLSQSGRSYSHAQMAYLQGGPSASPPISHAEGSPPPFAPSSLSFAKQALPRQSPYGIHSTSSPFVPSSIERDSPLTGPGFPKRYSSSLSHHRQSIGSSPQETHGLPSSVTLTRRLSTRESGFRRSLDEAPADSDDVHAFLRALDSWTPPLSLAPRSSSASLPQSQPGNPALTTTAATPGSGGRSPITGSGSGSSVSGIRVPLTRTHVDDMLKRMAGSFGPTVTAPENLDRSRPSSSQPTPLSRPGSNGSAENQAYHATGMRPLPIGGGALGSHRPVSSSPRVASLRSEVAGSPSSLTRVGSVPRASGSLPRAPALASTPEEPPCFGAARSLPAGPAKAPGLPKIGGTTPCSPFTSRLSPGNGIGLVSPQITGGTRRGPVLVRGGFGAPSASSKTSTSSSSPSHSPVREYRYRSGLTAERERSERERDGGLAAIGLPPGYAIGGTSGTSGLFSTFSNGGARGGSCTRRTAPSSLSADHEMPRMRGRVASEGGGSQIRESEVRSTSPRSAVNDRLMARLALAHEYDGRARAHEISASPTEE